MINIQVSSCLRQLLMILKQPQNDPSIKFSIMSSLIITMTWIPLTLKLLSSTVQAYAAMTNQNKFAPSETKPRMSRDQWYTLNEKERLLWDQFDDKAKATILGLSKPAPKVVSSGGIPKRKANLHEISAYDFLQLNMHDLMTGNPTDDPTTVDEVANESEGVDDGPNDSTLLVNAAKSSKSSLSPGDIQRVLSKSSTRSMNMAHIVYTTSASRVSGVQNLSLVDRGANGGLAGDDVRVISKTNRRVDIRGIDNHQVTGIDIGTVGGVVDTQKGPVVAIMHQYALLGKGSSIHSPCQMEHFKNQVDDKSKQVGGKQAIITLRWLCYSSAHQGWLGSDEDSPLY